MCFGSSASLQSIPSSGRSIIVDQDTIEACDSARNLGVQFDCEMSMRAQIARRPRKLFLPPATSTSGSPATGTPGGSTTRVSIYHKSTRLWQCHTFWIATVHSRTTTASFERSRTSRLRSSSTRTCDQCTNRFTLASCCCTYRIQDMRASVPSLNSSAPAYISDMLQPVSTRHSSN